MDPVRRAIGELLSKDTALGELLSSPTEIHHDKAAEDAVYPYVIFRNQGGSDVWAMASAPAFTDAVWMVKGLCRGLEAEAAEDIDARCTELLNDAELSIEGGTLLFCLREGAMPPYSEDDTGQAIYHRGGLYRVKVE